MTDLATLWVAKLRSLVKNLLHRERAETDLDEELRAYAELLADEQRSQGTTPEAARRAASLELGGIETVKEQVRDARMGAAIDGVLRDLRFGVRTLLRAPGFVAVSVTTLALCIGANAALFSVVHALLLRPLPYADADRLMYVSEHWPHEAPFRVAVSPDYGAWRATGTTFADIEAYNRSGGGVFHLTGDGAAERLDGAGVTAGFLDLLGAPPAAGRSFTAEECLPGASPVVILSHALWRRRFGASPEALSKTILLNGVAHTIVGVLPASFNFPDNEYAPDLILPLTLPASPNWADEAGFRVLRALVRLNPDVGANTVAAELTRIARSTAAVEPVQFRTMRRDMEVRVTPLRERLVGDLRPLLLILQAAVGMVLLIGCLNLANLQIARAAGRERELAVRAALGAGRGRLARQLLVESLLLALAGAAAGLGLGYAALPLLREFLPADVGLLRTVRLEHDSDEPARRGRNGVGGRGLAGPALLPGEP